MSILPSRVLWEFEAESAYEEWGANCGPGALAGILGLSLDEIRPHMGNFEQKGYTNPTLMYAALESLGVQFEKLSDLRWPTYGLVRIQWEGPWTHWHARARHTHWIGTSASEGGRGVFDINCVNNGNGWVSLADWACVVVPHLTALYPKATGTWSIANSLELDRTAVLGEGQ